MHAHFFWRLNAGGLDRWGVGGVVICKELLDGNGQQDRG